MRGFVKGIGLLAPGLDGYASSAPTLAGEMKWQATEVQGISADMLPPNERRRTTKLIKHALSVADMAVKDSREEYGDTVSIFASSDGDTEILHKICGSLCQNEIFISPTLFHNSVHNAPAGYWAIASNSHAPSTSISAGDGSFAAGLLESLSQIATNEKDVLLVVYDCPPPSPLSKKRNIGLPFAMAFLLGGVRRESSSPCIKIDSANFFCLEPESRCLNESLEPLRNSNPAARSLPLLEKICRKENGSVILPYGEKNLLVDIEL